MAQHSPAWYDEQYNNRARVPECVMHMQRWAHWSAQTRSELSARLDLAYGPSGKQTLDVFDAPTRHAPIVVFIHGGYWRSLDKSDHSFVAPAIQKAGAMPVIVNYDLAPQVSISEICLQMVRALAWVWRHGADFGGDPERIHVVGHSAGGHLAAMVLACQWQRHEADLPPDLVKSALSISGLYELESISRSPMLQADLRLDAEQVLRCSPAWMPPPAHGTCWSVVGGLESEAFIRHHRLIQTAWGLQRVPVCEVLPGLHHFNVLTSLTDPSSRLHQMALSLMKGT